MYYTIDIGDYDEKLPVQCILYICNIPVCYQVCEQVLLYYIDNIGNKSMQTKVDLLYQNDLTDEYC